MAAKGFAPPTTSRRRGFRPFVEARAFVHALELKNVGAWNAYCRSGKKPDDIAAAPEHVYRAEWRDWVIG